MIKKVYIKVPASIGNIGSGFDCAGLSLKLYNEFNVERAKATGIKFSKSLEGVSSEEVLTLFLKAFNATIKILDENPFPVEIKMENNIPFKRGFGSSATVILAGVISAFLLTGRKIRKEDVLRISLPVEGHIDNLAASLYGGFTVARTDTLTVVSAAPPEDLMVVAFIPEEGLSTKKARDILPENISMADAIYNISNMGLLSAAIILKKIHLLKFATEDKLHQPYRALLIPYLKSLLEKKIPSSVISGCLSGAGPSVVFFTEKRKSSRALLDIENVVKEEKLKGKVSLFTPGGKTSWKVVK